MGVNGYQGSVRARDQLDGVFTAGTEIMDIIRAAAAVEVQSLEKLIIWTRPETKFKLNDVTIEMGKTYMYEAWHVDVTSIKFVDDNGNPVDSPPETTIDFIIKKYDPYG